MGLYVLIIINLYSLDTQKTYRMTIDRDNKESQEINILLRGRRGESMMIKNIDFLTLSTSFTFYNAISVTISTVQKITASSSSYK